MSNVDWHAPADGIAVIGMSGRFPGARNIAELWKNLREGTESIKFFSEEELAAAGINPEILKDPGYVKAKGVLEDPGLFDASFFGFTPREAEIMDPQHRIFLECAWEALEDAGYNPATYPGPISVYAGASAGETYLLNNIYSNEDLKEAIGYQLFLSNLSDSLTTRVSYTLNLKGPSIAVQTACSTSLVAVSMACQSLLSFNCDMALAGGVSLSFPPITGYRYREGMIFSPDGHCKAFDAQAAGTVTGNGAGVVLLKRLDEALAEGDNIYAVIRGTAVNNDGSVKVGYTAPSVEGQAEVIAQALAVADVDPDTITYIEAHGTGTPLGDPIEIAALTKAFRSGTSRKQFCAIGSVKTNIGHLDAAAGIAGFIKTALALKHALIPPSLHFGAPNPEIDFANSPFFVNGALARWRSTEVPRRAGVSSFGMGGTNAHAVLEQGPEQRDPSPSRPWQLLLLSARTKTALDAMTNNLIAHLGAHPELDFADVIHTLHVGRKVFNHRRMLACQDAEDATITITTMGTRRVFTDAQEATDRPVVLMFSGQGSQYVNMGRELYEREPVFRAELDDCADALEAIMGLDIRNTLYPSNAEAEAAEEQLKQTAITQPSLFAVEYALAKLWMSWGVQPAAMIGHSIGEYVAACISGVLSLQDALSLVAVRGQLMQQMPRGAMLSVSLSEKEIEPFLRPGITLAAINAPSLCVVAGPIEAIDELMDDLDAEGTQCQRLLTSHAFHSAMMDPILTTFTEMVQGVSLGSPQIPYISNVTGTWITDAEATSPEYWAKHMRQAVLFSSGLQQLMKDQTRVLLEVGPGRTLTTLVKQQPNKTSELLVVSSLRHPHEQQSDVGFMLNALGRMWLAGFQVNWSGFYAYEKRRRVSLPTYPFERQRYWIDPAAPSRVAGPLAAPIPNREAITDWFYVPSWKQSALPRPKARDVVKQPCLLFIDDLDLGRKLAQRLEREGYEVVTVVAGQSFQNDGSRRFTINPRRREDYDALLGELIAAGRSPRVIAHMWGVTPIEDVLSTPTRLEERQALGVYSLVLLTQAIGGRRITDTIWIAVVTNGAQKVGDLTVPCPEKATVLGACKVITKEYQSLRCSGIDVTLHEPRSVHDPRLIENLVLEIAAQQAETVVAYRGGERWVQTFEPVRIEPVEASSPGPIKDGGVYLITGGLGGIGLVLAESLAAKARVKLVLIGRSALPPRHEWNQWLAESTSTSGTSDAQNICEKIRKVQRIEQLGAEVMPVTADVSDSTQMEATIRQVHARFGKIHGVIHAAGVPGGGMIQRKAIPNVESTLAAKVRGTLILDALLRDEPLDFFVLCSSLASILGVFGQVDYCSANAFLDAFAHYKTSRDSTFTVSVNWDGWQEIGMAAEAAKQRSTGAEPVSRSPAMTGQTPTLFKDLKEYLLPREGTEAFHRILAGASPQVIVSKQDLRVRMEQSAATKALTPSKDSGVDSTIKSVPPRAEELMPRSLHPRPKLETEYVAPRTPVEQSVADIWQKLLGIERVGIHDNFFDLDGDSLMAVQVIAKLRDVAKVDLPAHCLLTAPTIADLSDLIAQADSPSSMAFSRRRPPRTLPSTIVKIKSGGSRQALFLVHPVGGHVYFYRDLANCLSPGQTVYGIQAQGIDGKAKPLTRVEEMAALYIEAVLAVQPEGPYFLAGSSFGGVIAYEMAQQMKAAGQVVALLAMIDSPSPGHMPHKLERDADILAYLLGVGDDLPVPSMRIQKLSPDEQLLYFLKQGGIAKRMLPDLALAQVRHFLHLFTVNSEAMLSYVPRPYSGQVVFFRASEPDGYNSMTLERGWLDLVQGGFIVHQAAGNHITMNFRPNVDLIAQRLCAYIEEAQRARDPSTSTSVESPAPPTRPPPTAAPPTRPPPTAAPPTRPPPTPAPPTPVLPTQ